jgi:prevent-host-death family protein
MDDRYVAATEFKANCLRLMDEVAQQRRPIIITKRGKPVAKLVPVEEEADRSLRAHGRKHQDMWRHHQPDRRRRVDW